MTERRAWTPHELMRANAWRKAGHTYAEIGSWLGRPTKVVQAKLNYSMPANSGHIASSAHRRSVKLLAEAQVRREAADRRDLTQTFFGDPPVGYSALDRKRAAERPV